MWTEGYRPLNSDEGDEGLGKDLQRSWGTDYMDGDERDTFHRKWVSVEEERGTVRKRCGWFLKFLS